MRQGHLMSRYRSMTESHFTFDHFGFHATPGYSRPDQNWLGQSALPDPFGSYKQGNREDAEVGNRNRSTEHSVQEWLAVPEGLAEGLHRTGRTDHSPGARAKNRTNSRESPRHERLTDAHCSRARERTTTPRSQPRSDEWPLHNRMRPGRRDIPGETLDPRTYEPPRCQRANMI